VARERLGLRATGFASLFAAAGFSALTVGAGAPAGGFTSFVWPRTGVADSAVTNAMIGIAAAMRSMDRSSLFQNFGKQAYHGAN
jgi:hypothetical protein